MHSDGSAMQRKGKATQITDWQGESKVKQRLAMEKRGKAMQRIGKVKRCIAK
jgi:hypothetical protein